MFTENILTDWAGPIWLDKKDDVRLFWPFRAWYHFLKMVVSLVISDDIFNYRTISLLSFFVYKTTYKNRKINLSPPARLGTIFHWLENTSSSKTEKRPRWRFLFTTKIMWNIQSDVVLIKWEEVLRPRRRLKPPSKMGINWKFDLKCCRELEFPQALDREGGALFSSVAYPRVFTCLTRHGDLNSI